MVIPTIVLENLQFTANLAGGLTTRRLDLSLTRNVDDLLGFEVRAPNK